MSWAETDEAALESSREWKGTIADDNCAADIHVPSEVERLGAEISDTKWKLMGAISSDPSVHVRKLKVLEKFGATIVVVVNISGADPHGALRTDGREVLPTLRA